ncbi:DUF4383 domain-containing protein [Oculatella sp. LEGE 06141]|uniref:DUF4383 domain-containing protein n=1 Tax=Oculatella sp. LEGE 06141 TaxID=1828648 RepID=UPI00187F6488|nr:DUF4383 domain-containing protein [Oculatella sp. LEGE 06141]MBE9181576.1 DUF4383 domain-containing protein [Oculatella sp. LEGE 06141]
MKAGQNFALITGVLFLMIGISGFVPGLVKAPSAGTADFLDAGYGYLMGLFPINVPHNIVHLTVGVLGILSSIALGASRLYGRGLAFFYGALAIMGLLPYTNTTLGLIPIYGNDVWLHALTAAIAFYFGFIDSPKLLDIVAEQEREYQRYSSSLNQS